VGTSPRHYDFRRLVQNQAFLYNSEPDQTAPPADGHPMQLREDIHPLAPVKNPETSLARKVLARVRAYWRLIKFLQTGLLLLTAIAGYATGDHLYGGAGSWLGLAGSMFLAIAGSTVLTMALDRDLDASMHRTAGRPLPMRQVSLREAVGLGTLFSLSGIAWAWSINLAYGAVVSAGLLLNLVVYSLWLKRRSPYSILLGGLSGGMPILAGRVLATGASDTAGWLMMLGILLWIPTHFLTLSIKYAADYQAAGIPTFVSQFGKVATRLVIAVSTILDVLVMLAVGEKLSLPSGRLVFLAILGILLIALVGLSILKPGEKLNFALYKGASIYMLGTMVILVLSGL
jgi:protoheme IX farnesyltransferase